VRTSGQDAERDPQAGAGNASPAIILSAQGLTMRFGPFTAVDNVDLEIREGQVHALVGPNGAGKSTLLSMLGGQLLQTSGELRFQGRPLRARSPHHRARLGFGRAFQLTSVIPGFSCLENVVLAVEARHRMLSSLRLRILASDHERATELLDLVGLARHAQTPADVLGHGGQKQLEVAMALGNQPRLLLLDEPTSGLTAHERANLADLLERVAQRSTIVMAEHDVSFVRRIATRVTAFSLGRKIAEGSADEVFAHPQVREVFLRGADNA
jgi:ABC-type branched-subunit amino acid transport system ATPase component